ncbi:uncharacterized protein LOC134234482 isoform X1 [Saccostrea cucullata]|uniref:uncharacterized protein LOC134234482 isoform X1 n=2 Tax=Saccostrea cuccullata TaxID=36930 RepID=UPI002ECFEAAD
MTNTAMFISFLAILIGAVNLAVLVVNSVLLFSMPSREYENCTRMCLPCETEENGLCCDCQVEGLQGYLTKLYERTTETSGKYKGFSDNRIPSSYYGMSSYYKPAAKLSGDTENNQDKTSNMKTVKSWRNDNMCYLINGMALRHGRLVVPLAGVYHVYAMFDISLLNNTREASIVIMKYNILKDEEVLLSRPLSNWAVLSPQNNYQHIYLGADFLLNQEDEIYIKLSHTLQFKNPSANVFGLYML